MVMLKKKSVTDLLQDACFQVVLNRNPAGSGFFFSRRGYALTAQHVLPPEAQNTAINFDIIYDGKEFPNIMTNVPPRSYSMTEGDVAFASFDQNANRPGVKCIPLSSSRRTDWRDGRKLVVFGFSHAGHATLTGTVDADTIHNTPDGRRLIKLNLTPNGGKVKPIGHLKGLSGAPVLDCQTRRVVAIVQSFEAQQVTRITQSGKDKKVWIVYAAPIMDFERITAGLQSKLNTAMRATAIVLIMAVVAFVIYVWRQQPQLEMATSTIGYELGPHGGDITLRGESSHVAGTGRELLFFVNPENEFARGWYLQRENKGVEEVLENGTWHGTVQLGSDEYPPDKDGQEYSLAIIVASRKRADKIRDRAAKEKDYKLLHLPGTNYITCWVHTWGNLEFQDADSGG